MSSEFSIATVLVSALVSIATGYIGALLSNGRLRRQDTRTYGLALMAEVKSVYRSLWRYQARIARLDADRLAAAGDVGTALSLWRHDLSVFATNSGRIGLFSARTAVELIEFYHRIRWLEARAAVLAHEDPAGGVDRAAWIAEQVKGVRLARQHGRYLSRLLRREIPATPGDLLHGLRRGRWTGRRLRPKGDFLARRVR
jgi:hypothetical protein